MSYNVDMRRPPKGSEAEKRIESFLEHHLDLIEPGLTLLRRQYPLYLVRRRMIGKIDLFCSGEDRADVCIELVSASLSSNDLGQIMAYWDILSRRAEDHRRPMPRLYAIGPGMTPAFRHALNVLGGGEQINLTVKLFSFRHGVSLDDDEWPIDVHDYEPHLKIPM